MKQHFIIPNVGGKYYLVPSSGLSEIVTVSEVSGGERPYYKNFSGATYRTIPSNHHLLGPIEESENGHN
ncbi:hypothetical protein [Vibrio alginolyticus]|uniref:hypothetical protein n=1 Tax=Vibrio alginolyticus TaxID=663 RepID=UPI000B220962|nr:hypothetical protein [Vibrio alginolyticus]CAH7202442.1 hypothetical protein VCHA51O444_10712 [Vibrio chagasii]CAH7369504.1 hypothetical protein VCHA53O474_30516 [Vibrio chagasii]